MKVFITIVLSCLCFSMHAQIIFQEDFDGVPGPTAGGAGTYTFPSGWLLRNVDNKTPAGSVSYVNEAWERREDFSTNVTDSAAFSTSWYNPAGAADDWMWTPAIAISDQCELRWNAVTYDPLFPDGYEVRVMVAPDVPTGGTGVLGNQESASTLLFTVGAENTTWTTRTIDLAAYEGETVYFGFRNNSNDKFLLLIDDVIVERLLNYDARLVSTNKHEYSQVPLDQNYPFEFSAIVRNEAILQVTNVVLEVNVYDESDMNVYTTSSTALASLDPDQQEELTATGTFVASATGIYRFEYAVSIAETDDDPDNDSASVTGVVVSDNVFARDMGNQTGQLGIGSGSGYIGQIFAFSEMSTVESIDAWLGSNPFGTHHVASAIFPVTNGVPEETAEFIGTPMEIPQNVLPAWYTFEIPGGLEVSPQDTFLFCVVELDSTIQIGQTIEIYTPGTMWIDFPTSPFGTWAPVENFGIQQFNKPLMLRLNMELPATCDDSILNGNEEGIDCGGSCGPCPDPVAVCGAITVYVNPGAPAYDGPGLNNIWLIPAEDLDAGSVSAYPSPSLEVKRYLTTLTFNWTTDGACIDETPNGGSLSNMDKGTVYRDCLPVRNADFNVWKFYKLQIQDPADNDECIGTVKVVPQLPGYHAPGERVIHFAMTDELIQHGEVSNNEASIAETLISEFYIAPNPGIDHMYLQWLAANDANVTIRITDISGSLVGSASITSVRGANMLEFDMSEFASGMYFVTIQSDKEQSVSKWIKS